MSWRALYLFIGLAACSQPADVVLSEDATSVEVESLGRSIDATLARAEASPTSWVIRGELAGLYRARARLTGDWTDYTRAQEQLDLGYAASEGSGPHMSQAALDYTLHRLSAIEPRLAQFEDRILLDDPQRADIAHRRGQVEMMTDGYDEAQALFDMSIETYDTMGAHADRARLAWVTGDFDLADAEYDWAEAMYHGTSAEPRAWFHLQRGLMDLDRGRFVEALDHYQDADAAMPGYWLVHEHIAEALWELGELDAAERLYEQVVQLPNHPDLLDTYAEFLMAQGRDAEAAPLLERAEVEWSERLATHPDAAYGHGIGHFLITDPERAVLLAEAQLDEQPSASARTVYAEALLATGRVADAQVAIDAALDTRWRHADTFAMGAQVYAALGDAVRADALCADARAMNPTADCGQ